MSGSTPADVLDLTVDPADALALMGTSNRIVLDHFAGPGGWSTGIADLLHAADLVEVGLEWDAAACLTRVANGHTGTLRADVAAYPVCPFLGRTVGYIGSPPCQTFSMAGGGSGREHLGLLCTEVRRILLGLTTYDEAMVRLADAGALDRGLDRREEAALAALLEGAAEQDVDRIEEEYRATLDLVDPRNGLILIPARTIRALLDHDGKGPTDLEWVALEQVPPAGPVFDAYAGALRELGFSVAAPVVNAADYGVPQTRERKFVLASRVRRVTVPEPTHARGGEEATIFGPGRLPWPSMARALGWGMTRRTYPTVTGGAGHEARWFVGGASSRALIEEAAATAGEVRASVAERLAEEGLEVTASADPEWVTRDEAPILQRMEVGKARLKDGEKPTRDVNAEPSYTLTGGDPAAGGNVRLRWAPDGDVDLERTEEGGIAITDVELVGNVDFANTARRTLDQPAMTITGGKDYGSRQFVGSPEALAAIEALRPGDAVTELRRGGDRIEEGFDPAAEPSATLTSRADRWQTKPVDDLAATLEDRRAGSDQFSGEWAEERPATVVASREIVQHPGATKNRHNNSDKTRNDGLRITEEEGGILQGFPPGYRWEGPSKGKRWEQIGNVVCPPVARRIVAELLGVEPSPLPWHVYAWDEAPVPFG